MGVSDFFSNFGVFYDVGLALKHKIAILVKFGLIHENLIFSDVDAFNSFKKIEREFDVPELVEKFVLFAKVLYEPECWFGENLLSDKVIHDLLFVGGA